MEVAEVRRCRMRVFARAVDGPPVAGAIEGLDAETAERLADQLRAEGVQVRVERYPAGWRVMWSRLAQ